MVEPATIGTTIVASWGTIVINRNVTFDATRRYLQPDGFLHFRYFLDIQALEGAESARYIVAVGQLLTNIWRQGTSAVAACDFEEELPRRGGYAPEMRRRPSVE